MKLNRLIVEELRQRKVRLATSLLVILLASALVVTVHSIARSSRTAVAGQLQRMGATLIVLSASLSLADYYRVEADLEEMPESYFYKLTSTGLLRMGQVRALLNIRQNIEGVSAIVTGLLPLGQVYSDEVEREVWLGHDIAHQLEKRAGQTLSILDQEFRIVQILPEKGTIDDMRVTMALASAQQLFDRGRNVNAIEVTSQEAERLAMCIKTLLPDARVITKTSLARTQEKTLYLLRKYAYLLLSVVLVVGGVSIANFTSANVRERRREIGTLLAIGATPRLIRLIFIKKAVYLGLAGGLLGYLFGTVLAVWVGPGLLDIPVVPRLDGAIWAVLVAVSFSLIFSCLPAQKAAGLDPAAILQED